MKSNIRMLGIFTIFFIAAILIYFIPGNKNLTEGKTTIYTSAYTNWRVVTELQRSLQSYKVNSTLLDKDNDADIKLKYSAMIDDKERRNYDLYLVGSDKMVAVTSGEYPHSTSSLNIKELIDSQNADNGRNIVILSPCAYNWLVKYNYIDKNEANVYVYLPKIISEDKSAIGIVFDSEIDNIKQYKPYGIFSNSSSKEIMGDSLYLMVKKGKMNEKELKALVDNLKKSWLQSKIN